MTWIHYLPYMNLHTQRNGRNFIIAQYNILKVVAFPSSGFKQKIRPQPVAHAASRPPPEVGLFSSRAPHRPNPIALSALRVIRVDRGKCKVLCGRYTVFLCMYVYGEFVLYSVPKRFTLGPF